MGYGKLPKKISQEITTHYYKDRYVQRPKYSNRSCYCMKQHKHDSILEADYCNELSVSGVPFSIQHKIEIRINGKFICSHYVDFAVWNDHKVGSKIIEFIEVKGYATDLWKLKRKLVEATHPEVPYTVKSEKPKWQKK